MIQSVESFLKLVGSRPEHRLIIGILIAVVIPYLFRWDVEFIERVTRQTHINASFGVLIAVIVGFFFFERLARFPGIETVSHVFPIFAVTFLVIVSFYTLFRIDYSRLTLLTGFVACQAWFHAVYFANRWASRLEFAVVPLGHINDLVSMPHVKWSVLDGPQLADRPLSGVVADLNADLPDEWETFLAAVSLDGVPVFAARQLRESLTGRVELDHLSENHLGTLMPNSIYKDARSVADRLIALVALPILIPIFCLIALVIKSESAGPVFFRQRRTGLYGREFLVWKFRTMYVDRPSTEPIADSLTMQGDPRITAVGKFLRRTRIDELPQLFNVLKGEMGWIGPRPVATVLADWFEVEVPFYRYRHIVRPGLTGWAQINQGYTSSINEEKIKLQYDLYYIKNYSFWIDALIILRTIKIIISGAGVR
jgi:lipopolysaccharide/colanic/teichoic acid biosynthesis glycosyltransferase